MDIKGSSWNKNTGSTYTLKNV